jgi:tetratricopeptide (TPR) repeat protein
MRAKDLDGLRETIERANAANVGSDRLDLCMIMAKVRQGDAEQAALLLDHPLEHLVPRGTRMKALRLLSEDRAIAFARSIIELEDPSASALKSAAMFDYRLRDVSQAAIDRFFAVYPDRRGLHPHAIMLAWPLQQNQERAAMRRIAEIAREVSFDGLEVGGVLHRVLRANMFVRDWEEVRRHAELWLSDHPEDPEVHYYLAVAEARLGDYERAGVLLSRAIATIPARREGRYPSWFPAALLEDAWLRSSPEAPPALRDPKLARLRMEQFEAYNDVIGRAHFGPWVDLTRSEVLWANGQRDDARSSLRKAQRAARPNMPVPRDYQEFIQRAAERMKAK